jgi:hypothetical protein
MSLTFLQLITFSLKFITNVAVKDQMPNLVGKVKSAAKSIIFIRREENKRNT